MFNVYIFLFFIFIYFIFIYLFFRKAGPMFKKGLILDYGFTIVTPPQRALQLPTSIVAAASSEGKCILIVLVNL